MTALATTRTDADRRARELLAGFAAELAAASAWDVYRPHGGDHGDESYLGRTWSAEAAIAHVWAGNRLEAA